MSGNKRLRGFVLVLGALGAALAGSLWAQQEASPAEKVQKVVFSNCSGCHTGGGHAGGLQMDSIETLLKGGNRGAIVVPGKPDESLLVKALSYTDSGLQMPPRGKIPEADIDSVRTWVAGLTASAIAAPAANKVSEAAPKGRPMLAPPASTVTAAPEPEVVIAKADAVTPEQEVFFESKIRPVLSTNCYMCHTQAASGGLRLDSREAILKGGRSGAVAISGKPEESLLVKAIHYDPSARVKMPPAGKLKADEVAALETWIKDGLPWPEAKIARPVLPAKAREFWSFQAPVKPAVPAVNSTWVKNDIDRFVLAKLAEKNLKPVGDADKRTLIRRVTYDLTGLPPTAEEVNAFVTDKSPQAYESLIERLLASRAYGERWGRKWLDLARYADTSGSGGDNPIPQAIKYRDYVIRAFQKDKPYDRFVREQIAGDLMPAQTEEEHWENVVATGYLAGAPRGDERDSHISDGVDNLGYTFLGMSVGCARCHDHKFDPIPTANYYSLYGIYNSTKFPSPGDGGAHRFQTGFTYRDPKALEREDFKVFSTQLEPITNALVAVMKLPGTYDDLVPQLQKRRMNMFEHAPDLGESAYAVTEGEPKDEKIHIYGDMKNLGALAPRGFLQVLGGGPLAEGTKGSGRAELVDWLLSPNNPLTARVMVNRIWQGHFGKGIVATPNDFGLRGTAPSNQALLDYLAVKFVENGWSIKSMHRLILTSHAYQLSTESTPQNDAIDPENALIWRHSRHRLESEEIRDSMLAISGLLDPTPGGPHPFPAMASWNYEEQNMFEANPKEYENDKRSVYAMVQRTVRPQFFILFDGPSTNANTEQRTASLTPLQALYFMNGEFPKRTGAALASRLLSGGVTDAQAVDRGFQLVYGRPAAKEEADRSLAFLSQSMQGGAKSREAAFTLFAQALFASNEFMFVE
jgi:mono/diheme cytochrome c family protein